MLIWLNLRSRGTRTSNKLWEKEYSNFGNRVDLPCSPTLSCLASNFALQVHLWFNFVDGDWSGGKPQGFVLAIFRQKKSTTCGNLLGSRIYYTLVLRLICCADRYNFCWLLWNNSFELLKLVWEPIDGITDHCLLLRSCAVSVTVKRPNFVQPTAREATSLYTITAREATSVWFSPTVQIEKPIIRICILADII
jgi:hypothetical protein